MDEESSEQWEFLSDTSATTMQSSAVEISHPMANIAPSSEQATDEEDSFSVRSLQSLQAIERISSVESVQSLSFAESENSSSSDNLSSHLSNNLCTNPPTDPSSNSTNNSNTNNASSNDVMSDLIPAIDENAELQVFANKNNNNSHHHNNGDIVVNNNNHHNSLMPSYVDIQHELQRQRQRVHQLQNELKSVTVERDELKANQHRNQLELIRLRTRNINLENVQKDAQLRHLRLREKRAMRRYNNNKRKRHRKPIASKSNAIAAATGQHRPSVPAKLRFRRQRSNHRTVYSNMRSW